MLIQRAAVCTVHGWHTELFEMVNPSMFGLIQAVSSLQTIDFGVFLNAVKLPSDAAQRPNAGAFSATGGPFSNDTRAGWSLRVAGGGEAVKDSSPRGRRTQLFFTCSWKRKKSSEVFFLSKGKHLWREAWNMAALRMTQNDGRYLIFSSSFFSRWSKWTEAEKWRHVKLKFCATTVRSLEIWFDIRTSRLCLQ